MVKVVRGPAMPGMHCALVSRQGTTAIYLPEGEITQAGADALSDVLSELQAQRLAEK
jgi:uroporphyrinogen-III synthase